MNTERHDDAVHDAVSGRQHRRRDHDLANHQAAVVIAVEPLEELRDLREGELARILRVDHRRELLARQVAVVVCIVLLEHRVRVERMLHRHERW